MRSFRSIIFVVLALAPLFRLAGQPPQGPMLSVPGAPPVPASYQDLYTLMNTQIATFESKVQAGGSYPTQFSAIVQSANAARGPALLSSPYSTVTMELDSLKAMGVRAVSVGIAFPILYPGYYQNPTDYQQYLNFYTQVAQDVRARGLKLIVETGIVVNEPGISDLNCLPFYNSLTLSQYEQGRMQVAVTIAQQIKPDYLTLLNEPDTEAAQSGKAELGTVSGSMGLLNAMLGGLQLAGVKGLPLGAGLGTWTSSYQSFVQNYITTSIQYVDLHFYPVNYDFLTRALTIADMAHAAGKAVAVGEAWLHKSRDSELGVLGYPQVAARDPFSFWEPLDTAFLKALVNFSRNKQLLFFTPFYTTYFHAYLDYSIVNSLPVAQMMAAVSTAVSQNLPAAQYTPTAWAYSKLINSAPDTAAPSIPTGLSATGSSSTVIHVTWQGSTDNVGVAGYQVYRNGTPVGTTLTAAYFDVNLSPLTTYYYTVAAYDISGNISAPTSPVAGTTLSQPDNTPPSTPAAVSARAFSSSQINVSWSASTDNVGVAGYLIYKGATAASMTMFAGTTSNTFADTHVNPASTYYYAVLAYDAKGNKSPLSATLMATTPQEAPPSIPNGLYSSAVSWNQVSLSWLPSSSSSGLGGYVIYRGASVSSLAIITTTSTTAYVNTVVVPGTTYYYAVAAYDQWGLKSAPSAAISVTLPLSPPPSVPAGLSAQAVSSSQVNLTWSASTSLAGMGGYLVYKGSSASSLSLIANISGSTSYSDAAVSTSKTYYYALIAYDKWGSRSAASPAVLVKTP